MATKRTKPANSRNEKTKPQRGKQAAAIKPAKRSAPQRQQLQGGRRIEGRFSA